MKHNLIGFNQTDRFEAGVGTSIIPEMRSLEVSFSDMYPDCYIKLTLKNWYLNSPILATSKLHMQRRYRFEEGLDS